jgi:hypothetical protein
MREVLLFLLNKILSKELLKTLLLRKCFTVAEQDSLATSAEEASRAHFSGDSLALPAVDPVLNEALRRAQRRMARSNIDILLGLVTLPKR